MVEVDALDGEVNMEDNDELNNQDIIDGEEEISPFDIEEDDQVLVEEDDCEVVVEESSKYVVKTSYEAKLRELLRNLYSIEFKIHSEASKEFIKLLRSESGGDLLNQYVQASSSASGSCSELLEAWKLRQGKPGVAHVLLLISEVLGHPDGKYKRNDFGRIALSKKLDFFASTIIKTKMEDIYTELNSKEARRQNAALSVMAAIVRRGVGLASQVANSFDFKLPLFPKLAESHKRTIGNKSKFLTRHSFIEFAMSFLEIGDPRLLRWVLQLRDMYFGVLRGLGSDDDETIIYVISTLRDRVLTPDSLVSPGLRSVLFGTVTLDQLINISGNPAGGPSAKIAHDVLVMICTDPCNGLMPELKAHTNPLKGNPRRLLELMKKLNATEIRYHRDLLLAIVQGRPSFGSAYMDEFPYLLEPSATPTWFSAISLASDLVSSTRANFTFSSVFSQHQDPPSLDSSEVQCLLKCIAPRALNRFVMNRGLQHSDVSVKHGSMRLLLEALKSLDSLVGAIDCKARSKNLAVQKWMFLKHKVQDEARTLLPDSQVLYKLRSDIKSRETGLKRPRSSEELPEIHCNDGAKKLKFDWPSEDEDIEINISGIAPETGSDISKEKGNATGTFITELDTNEDCDKVIARIWGLHSSCILENELNDAETYFHSKLLDVLTLYLRTMPSVLDGSYDFFKLLPSNPFTLSNSQQQSVLSLLIEYIGCSPRSRTVSSRPPENMYKLLHPLLNLLIYSPVKGIQDQAYILVRAAMLSTGLFDRNCLEIDAWLLFLPGYRRGNSSIGNQAVEVFQDWSKIVVSFLCDAVSTTGNNLYKYMDHLRCQISNLKDFAEVSPDFSPLFICILKKCLRLLISDSGTFKLYEKSMVSMYVCNTLSSILQTQVDGRLLSSLIDLILTERFGNSSVCDDSTTSFCEWRPLKNLLLFSRSISHKKDDSEGSPLNNSLFLSRSTHFQRDSSSLCSIAKKGSSATSHSFANTLCETKGIIRSMSGDSLVGVAKAFCSSLVCASLEEILENFPSVITVSAYLLGAHIPFLSSLFFHEGNLLVRVANLWPDIFFSSLELVVVAGSINDRKDDILVQTTNTLSSSEELIFTMDFDSIESTSVAFSSFLKQASFHVLFPAIMGVSNSDLLVSTKLIDFLQGKLSEGFIDDAVASLRLLLFWTHQIQSSYRREPLVELEQLSKICFILIKHMLGRVLVLQSDSSNLKIIEASTATTCIQEIAETIFHHPATILSLSNPLCCNKDVTNGSLAGSLMDSLSSSNESIHPISNDVVHLLTTVADHLLGLGNDQNFVFEAKETVNGRLVETFKALVQRVILMFRKKFKMPINRKKMVNLLPSYYIFRGLIRIIPPFMLLELVDFIFERSDSIGSETVKVAAFSIGCYIAGGAFDSLSSYVHHMNTKTVKFSLFWEAEEKKFDLNLVEKVYHRILRFATQFKLECADLCLLKAVNVVYKQKLMPPQAALFPSCIEISRVIMRTPINLLAHCIQGTTATKAKLLFLLTEVSPLHLTLSGHMFLCIRNKDLPLKENVIGENSIHACTDEQFMMLLPVALSYLKMNSLKFGLQHLKHFQSIPSIYSKILLDGFLNWKSYTSGNIFQEEYDELSLSSTQELLNLFNHSVLGKAIHMLQYHYSLNVNSLKNKKRMKLFDSICQCSGVPDDFFDFDINDINFCSLQESLNFINRVIAKISFCRMLLFPKDSLIQPPLTQANAHSEEITLKEGTQILRFINILVGALHKIVKRFPLVTDDSVRLKSTDCSQLFRYLEVFILRNILKFSVKMRDDLVQMNAITFIEQFARSSFLHRFEDPTTLKVLRCVLFTLCEGKFSCGVIFELLQTHSKFVSSILWSGSTSDSSGLLNTGMLLRPMSSVLKSPLLVGVDQSEADSKIASETSPSHRQKLEVIRLFRVLYHLKSSQVSIVSGEDARMNSKKLLSLLLSCYGATVSEIDLEIFDFMHEIISTEVSEGVSIAEMDYLWGSSALKVRENTLESSLLFDITTDCETVEERRRRQFRENLSLDSKTCAATILNFPYDRVSSYRPISSKNLKLDDDIDILETTSTSFERIQRYDPAFILQFSIHGLSMGYLEPLEFAGLGLLAITFMSISSPDEGMRKLGYETLGRFKNALEGCRNRRDRLRLQHLLLYLQNEIIEPWQKIPSFTSIFAAEASFILLDPSHDHYHTMPKLLTRTPFNLKCIPLFNAMFGSISVSFKTDRLWILRLTHTGLNSEDDARIFIRNCVVEILLSSYTSSLSDNQTKTLILQIVRKSIKLPVLARHLVQQCNLISWLSFVLSSCTERLCEDDKSLFLTQITIVLEVVNGVISLGSICKWLRENALEQLSELSSHALKLFTGSSKMIKQNCTLDNLILQILVSTLRISQERNVDQPHFTLSYDGLYQLYEAIDDGSNNTRAVASAEPVLRAILMSAPPALVPHTDGGKLARMIMWGISTASKSHCRESDSGFTKFFKEQECEDSSILKLLRWVAASVILGRISRKFHKIKAFSSPEISNIQTLQLLLEHIKKVNGEVELDDREISEVEFSNNEALAAAILYLQQFLGMNGNVLPSVIGALCLLLLPDVSSNTGTVLLEGDQIDFVASMCLKIRCPAEANPAWRWSYNQPWEEHQRELAGSGEKQLGDTSSELTEVQKLEERHACEALLLIFSNALGGRSSKSQFLSHQDLNDSVFTWERNILVSEVSP